MYRFTLKNDRLGSLPLATPPVQWDSLAFEYSRDKKYHGIAQKVALEAEFVKEGYTYVKSAYEREGIESIVALEIERYNSETFEYELIYTGRLDFIKYQEGHDSKQGAYVSCAVDQGGYAQQFLNLDDVEVNLHKLETLNGLSIPAFTNEQSVITLHSKEIIKQFSARVSDFDPQLPQEYYIISSPSFTEDDEGEMANVLFGFDQVEINELGAYNTVPGFSLERYAYEHYEAKENGPHRIEFKLHGWVKALRSWRVGGVDFGSGDFDGARFKIMFFINNDAAINLGVIDDNDVNGAFYHEFNQSAVFYRDLKAGDKVFIEGRIELYNTTNSYEFKYDLLLFPDSYLKITGNTQTEPTPARGLLVHEALTRIIQHTSDLKAGLRSDHFGRTDSEPRTYSTDGPGSLLWISNGFQIRNFPLAEKPIQASFRNLFETLDAIYNVGVGIEFENGKEVLRIEPKSHFYKTEVVLQLGCVTNVRKSVAIDHFYNQAEFGYQQWQTEQTNGLEEFNARQTVTMPITQVKSKYSALSPYIASGYMLESTRRQQYIDTETKDSKSDNQNFVVCLLRNGNTFETERNQVAEVLENVISPSTVYNARISPARNKRRHGSILHAGLLKQQAKDVKFNNGEGNYKMRSRFAGETATVVEDENLLIADLPDPLWIPEYYDFTAPFTYAQQQQFETEPYGLVEFIDEKDGLPKSGFVVGLKTKPTVETGEFTLLRAYNG